MDGFLKDLRFGARICTRSPAFSFTIFFLLSLGIGVNVTVFRGVNAALFKPLPVHDPDRLLRVYGGRSVRLPYSEYETYRDANGTLSALAIMAAARARLQSEGLAEVTDVAVVSGNFFHALGVPAALGRTIQPADDNRGAPGVIVLSDSLWRRHFGADPDALGKTVRIEGDIFEIVGVAPSEFIGITFPFAYQAWVAWNSPISAPDSGEMVGRTRAGVELASVKADLSRIAAQIPDTQPFAQPGSFSTVRVYPARVMPPEILGQISVVAGILSTLSGVVLFALAVNIGTLMSARLTERRGEMAIRQSLGASRRRLCRQIVTEGLVVSVVASAGAAFLGYVATTALLRAPLPVSLPPAGGLDPGYDWRVMVFTLGLCLAVTLVFALLPALQLPSLRSATSLAADTMAGPSRSLRRAAFISLQLGLATLLIATAMTTIRGTVNFLSMDSGFETQGVWTARLNATRQGHTPESAAWLLDELLAGLESEPRIAAASLAQRIPLSFAWGEHPGPGSRSSGLMEAEATGDGGRSSILVFHNVVSSGHFRTLGIDLLAGRDFEAADATTLVGIVNETLAQRFWPGENPLGKRLRNNAEDAPWIDVVGIARDSKYSSIVEDPLPFIYLPITAIEDKAEAVVLLKTIGPDEESQSVIRDAIHALDPEMRPPAILSIEARMRLMFLRFRFLSAATTVIGGLALVLGLVGTYGLVEYLVSRRTHEMGVRLAVGATAHQVERLILQPCIRWTLVGIGIGIGSSVALTRVLGDRLYGGYGIVPDLAEYTVVAALMVCVSLCAAWLPVRKATRLDVALALRHE